MMDEKILHKLIKKINDIEIAKYVIELVHALEALVENSSRLLNIDVKARGVSGQDGEKFLKHFICQRDRHLMVNVLYR